MKRDYESISSAIESSLDNFFKMHNGYNPESGLYDRVIHEVEKILIEKTLVHTKKIQIQASKILGINRNTLRKKMKELNIS